MGHVNGGLGERLSPHGTPSSWPGDTIYKRLQLWHDGAMTRGRLRIGTFTPSLLIDVARSTGRLDRAALDVAERPVPSSPAQFRSLESGEFDVVMTSPDNVLAYRFLTANPLGYNLPVEILAGIDRGLGLSLWLAPSVADVAGVRGGVVGVDVPESGFAFVAFALLERAGLNRADYLVESLGSTPRRAAATR